MDKVQHVGIVWLHLAIVVVCSAVPGRGAPIDKCPQLPPHTAKNIFDLRPNDIKVVMAMGDSMTAGFGIMGVAGWIDEYRGKSGAIGGDPGQITVANFFKHYNPYIIGFSLGNHLVELPYEGYYEQDHLNAAQSNAGVDNLLYQLDYLVTMLQTNPRVNMTNDWKIVNLIIGANDVCPYCFLGPFRPTIEQAADNYEMYLSQVVQQAYEKIPRLFFNILPMFNISQVYNLSLNYPFCNYFHDVVPFECSCAFDTSQANRNYLDEILQAYNRRIYKLVQKWKVKKLPEFAVQHQLFTADLKIPNITYLSTLDCFHPSLLAHQKLAIAGWNSLLTPFAKKKRTFNPDDPLLCPTPSTLIYAD